MAGGGGNFDDPLPIDGSGHILPTGPFGILAGGNGLQLRFWVIQFQGGIKGAYMAAQGQPQAADSTMWETKNDASVFRVGKFQPGQAFATAVETLDTGELRWWSATLQLSPPAKT